MGGIKASDTSLDLAAISAIISSFIEKELIKDTLFLGEVGLNGEIRPVHFSNKRINEAVKLGFRKIILSKRAKFNKKFNEYIITLNHVSELVKLMNTQLTIH